MSDQRFPLERVFIVLRTLGAHGALKLVDLENQTPIPKTALHRICTQLEDLGWIRKRVCDKAMVLTYQFEEFFSTAQFASYEVEALQPLLKRYKKEEKYHIMLSLYVTRSVQADVDGTKMPAKWESKISQVFSSAAIVAQAAMSRDARLRMLTEYLKTAPEEEAVAIKSGEHGRRVRDVEHKKYILDPDTPCLHIGCIAPSGAVCAVSVEPVRTTHRAVQDFIKRADHHAGEVKAQIERCFQTFAV